MATVEEIRRLMTLIGQFATGRRQSLQDAQEIEVGLDDAFPEDEDIQDFVTDFASYRPGGGDYLYDEEALAKKCRRLLHLLEQRTKSSH